jgi:hypothetical protein
MLRRYLLAGLCLASLSWFPTTLAVAADDLARANQIKSAFIFNFTKFVSWPRKDVADFKICVLGTNSFGTSLDGIATKSTASRRYSILTNPTAPAKCHIAYITKGTSKAAYTAAVQNAGILTVSDVPGFAASGGMMEFVGEQNKVRLIVNLKALRAAGLEVDAQLLEVAQQVLE